MAGTRRGTPIHTPGAPDQTDLPACAPLVFPGMRLGTTFRAQYTQSSFSQDFNGDGVFRSQSIEAALFRK